MIFFSELNSKVLVSTDRRYIKVVSNNESTNWGGIFLVTNIGINLISISGLSAPKIVWSSTSSSGVTVSSRENNPLETIIDIGVSYSHILAIPVGSISRSEIEITNYI